jgi:hypothetical protein
MLQQLCHLDHTALYGVIAFQQFFVGIISIGFGFHYFNIHHKDIVWFP